MFSLKHTLFAILCLLVFNLSAFAIPLNTRQKDGSRTLETVTTEMTSDGPITATCTIVLTPVTDENGQAAVEKVETCTRVLNPATTSSPSQPTTSASPVETSPPDAPATTSTSSSTSTDSSATSTAVPATTTSAQSSGGLGAVSANPVSSVTLSSSSAASSSSPSNGAVSANPVSSVIANTSTPVTSSSPTSSSSGTSTPTAASSASAVAVNTSDASSASSTSSAAPSETAAAADSSNAAVSLPGKKLSVLPIGLGVFAGISVIALIVVGLVTYERRKYRKAFRQRKLAESGATMGYGGMAQ